MPSTKIPILIVGGGPTGLSLALFLNHWGVQSTILNNNPKPRTSPKGNTTNARTLEIFRQIGIIDDVRRVGLPPDHPANVSFFTRFSKHLIHRHHLPSMNERLRMRDEAPATDQYVEPTIRANHMYIEQLLFEKVRRCELVETRFGYEVTDATQTDFSVIVKATRMEDGEEITFEAEHVVDCSGKRSNIRRALEIQYARDKHSEDAVFLSGQFLNAWVRIPDINTVAPAMATSWFNFAINADRSTRGMLISMNGNDDFVFMTKVSDGDWKFSADEVVATIRRMIGNESIAVQVLDHNPWTAGAAAVVDRYQAGRIFLAGDAAHVFTPAGAFGMNTGVDDAHNLAWKLAAAHRGWGGPNLLGTYTAERQPIGVRNTSTSHKSVGGWIEPLVSEALELDGPEGEAARAEMARQRYVTCMHLNVPEEDDFTGIQLGARYDGSPLIVSDERPPVEEWPRTFHRYTPSSVPGGRLPHLWLEDGHGMGDSIFDRLGRGFTLLRINSAEVDVSPLERLAAGRCIPLKVLDVGRPEAVVLYEKRLLLVRPDHYIAWRGDELPQDCNALLDRVCGYA